MGLLSSLLESLKDKQQPIVLPDALTFTAIDASAIEAQLQLKKRAEELGKKGYPPKDQIPPDSVEGELIREVTLRLRPIQDLYAENQKAYAARMASLEPLTLASQVEGNVAAQKAEIAVELAVAKNHMFSATSRLEECTKHYHDLKNRYGGVVDPVDQTKPWWRKILLIASLIFIEGVINGASIQPYMVGGWADALTVTVGIPFLTVGVLAFLVGTGLQLTARDEYKRLRPVAWLCFLLGVSVASIANLYISAFRVAGVQSLETLSSSETLEMFDIPLMPDVHSLATEMWRNFLSGNFNSLDVVAILLFALASTFFIFAVFKFYHFSHRYPDLVESYLHLQSAIEEHKTRTLGLKDKYKALTNFNSEFDRVYTLLQAWAIEHSQLVQSQNTLFNKFVSYQDHCKQTLDVLVRKYRGWNLAARDDPSSAPMYFRGELGLLDIREPSPVSDESSVRDYVSKLERANKAIQAAQSQISDAITQFSEVVESVSDVGRRNA